MRKLLTRASWSCVRRICAASMAHAHLGNFVFEHRLNIAVRHFEVGVRIGELSLPPKFEGLLLWDHIDNRPFMRCLYGYGLCLWRLDRFEEAERVFKRMLWLNPLDEQGVRSLIDKVRVGWRGTIGEKRENCNEAQSEKT